MDHSSVAIIHSLLPPLTNVHPFLSILPLEIAELLERSYSYLNYKPFFFFFFGQVTLPLYQLSNLAQEAAAQNGGVGNEETSCGVGTKHA